jgi:hypothetical protein
LANPYFLPHPNPLNQLEQASSLSKTTRGVWQMNTDIRSENEIVIEIEELEAKIAPSSSSSFLD